MKIKGFQKLQKRLAYLHNPLSHVSIEQMELLILIKLSN
jgi:hypothetical protein